MQKATNQFEMEATIWTSDRFCSYSTSFLPVMFTRIYLKLNGKFGILNVDFLLF